jgi:hypothetical protein
LSDAPSHDSAEHIVKLAEDCWIWSHLHCDYEFALVVEVCAALAIDVKGRVVRLKPEVLADVAGSG